MHHFVVADGQHKVLAERIEEAEGNLVVVACAEERIGLHVAEHVVHPAHVPLEVEAQAAVRSGLCDHRPCGGLLRDHVLVDELPQLLNILKGDLSIVGPRPERPEIAAQYCEEMPEFALRLQAKAGLTGYAQVYGKYNTTPYDKLQMDLMYIAHPSIVEDLKIMLATIKILFMPESTEGVAEGQTTAMGQETK